MVGWWDGWLGISGRPFSKNTCSAKMAAHPYQVLFRTAWLETEFWSPFEMFDCFKDSRWVGCSVWAKAGLARRKLSHQIILQSQWRWTWWKCFQDHNSIFIADSQKRCFHASIWSLGVSQLLIFWLSFENKYSEYDVCKIHVYTGCPKKIVHSDF